MTFGEYKDWTIEEIYSTNADYIKWLFWNIEKFFLTPEAVDYLEMISPKINLPNELKRLNEIRINKTKNLDL